MSNVSPTLAVLFHRLGPYHFARLRAAGRLLPIVAIESSGVDKTYAWDKVSGADHFERVTLFDSADAQNLPAAEVASRVGSALDKVHPAVVAVPGWADSAALGALRWCVQNQVPAIVMSESTEWDKSRAWWKEWVKSRVVRLCAAALAGGRPHADYLLDLGMPRERIFLGYDAVDNDYFEEKAETLKTEMLKVESRNKYGLPEKYFLASARFVAAKNLPRLLQAYAQYRVLAEKAEMLKTETLKSESSMPSTINHQSSTAPWDLVLLGDGPLRSSILNLRSSLGLDACVHLPGFKQYPDLPIYYGLAKAFIHASTTEPWGLVVNEAMASGLPVLVSNRCGCAVDLVKDGVNGFTFDPYDVEQLAQLMLKISLWGVGPSGPEAAFQPFRLSAFGDASREIISNWGPERFAEGLCAASEQALKGGAKRAMIFDRLLLMSLSRRPSPTNSTTSVGASHSMKHSKISDKEAVQQFFTATALGYSKFFLSKRRGSNFGFRERLALAVQMTAGISGSLLDCACGTGEITTAIVNSRRFARATIIDLSPRMLEITRQQMEAGLKRHKLDQLKLISSDIFEFAAQTGAGRYDLILCLGLIAHTGRLDCLLSRLKGLLAPDGKILLQSTLLDHLGTKVVRALTQERYYHRQGYRISYFRHQDILQVAREVGLESVAVKRFTFGFPFGDRFWAGMNYRLEQRMQNWAKLHGAEAMYLLQHNSHEP
jgi:glycosyltransferase involved in cell wall biosynthesis/2-polyprenyl-3-methyl-5-hydroxy-6-metoxy-1,4-benzoquinol methylase